MRFADRRDAGQQLARRLGNLRDKAVVVLALPRGGVPVAAEVAAALHAPLEVFVARKLGAPGRPELGIGAVAEGDVVVLDDRAGPLRGSSRRLRATTAAEQAELARRVRCYRGDRALPQLRGRTVVLVDDGLATGATARAALTALRAHAPARLVLAVPVAPPAAVAELAMQADEVIAVHTPHDFTAVGRWYDNFDQTTDDEVLALLRRAQAVADEPLAGGASSRTVRIAVGDHELDADVTVPPACRGAVVFAHGSGSGRASPRNRSVASALQAARLATVLADLLTTAEQERDRRTGELRFDIGLLAMRLAGITTWTAADPAIGQPVCGLYGASTGAAAALAVAAEHPDLVAAVVSRGGRPDLAGDALGSVRAPTLLIVGSNDPTVLRLNRESAQRLTAAAVDLAVVPGVTHLFGEPGALEQVAHLAVGHFERHVPSAGRPTAPPA
jgi:putative phosphoribosyl transferase